MTQQERSQAYAGNVKRRQRRRLYDIAADDLFSRLTVKPDATRKAAISTLIVALKQAGVWDQLDAFYAIAAADAQTAQRNWIRDSYNLVPTGTITFVADRGYTGNGTTGYLATGFTPSLHGQRYALNSAHIGVRIRNNVGSSSMVDIGARNAAAAGQALINTRTGTNVASFGVNRDAAGLSPASTDSIGSWLANRSASTVTDLFKNGASIQTDVPVSTALPASPIVIGAVNTAGVISGFSTRQYAAASIGGSLTAAQAAAYHTALLAYLTAVGAA